MDLFPQMDHSYIESLHSVILSLKVGYRTAVLGTANSSNEKGHLGPTGQSGHVLKPGTPEQPGIPEDSGTPEHPGTLRTP